MRVVIAGVGAVNRFHRRETSGQGALVLTGARPRNLHGFVAGEHRFRPPFNDPLLHSQAVLVWHSLCLGLVEYNQCRRHCGGAPGGPDMVVVGLLLQPASWLVAPRRLASVGA